MPQYLTRKENTFYFRQVVPLELRSILGKREIKKSLGRDYPKAVRECKRFAVEADNLIADARARIDNLPVAPYSREGIARTRHVTLTSVTPELEEQFCNLMKAALLETDQETRITGLDREEFEEYSQHIDEAIQALRRQLAMGNVEPLMHATRVFLVARGYQPEFSKEDWRRLAYAMTRASLEAYEDMAARQAGKVIKQPTDIVLSSQYEVQNAPNATATSLKTPVTWANIYAVWDKECERRENTKSSYLAAMKLFMSFCKSAPQAVTREDVLEYRDFLLHEEGLAPGTVANKIGFCGTIINAGRNNSQYSAQLPKNPFEDIKVKRTKRGVAGKSRLPFNDAELQLIFNSPIYTKHHRPEGGGGEAAAWIPAIGYLTGMRLEEIALLKKSQFHEDANGIPYIHTEDGKTEQSADRDVPIHSALIEAGLLDFVKNCSGRLFPKVTSCDEVQSKAFSKWFGRHLHGLGITAGSKVFHSFRHLFKDLCRNTGLDDSIIDQICGHEPGSVGGRYGTGRRIDVLSSLIDKIVPPVKLPIIMVKGLKN
ncbi:MAG: site-specific integrase [Sterolibacterium sp.]